MKKTTLTIACMLISILAFTQEFKKPAEGKSLVYFVRTKGAGSLINFKFFDGKKFLGKMSGANYFTYECDPGNHLFWVASENKDFIQGELIEGGTYIIQSKPQAGAFTTRVALEQVFPNNDKLLKKIRKVLSKKSEYNLKGKNEDFSLFIGDGMKRFENIKHKVKKIDPKQHF
ncbi:MAG: hypothetical protein ACPF80_03370 [Flavobacteriaceae bacterium]